MWIDTYVSDSRWLHIRIKPKSNDTRFNKISICFDYKNKNFAFVYFDDYTTLSRGFHFFQMEKILFFYRLKFSIKVYSGGGKNMKVAKMGKVLSVMNISVYNHKDIYSMYVDYLHRRIIMSHSNSGKWCYSGMIIISDFIVLDTFGSRGKGMKVGERGEVE